MKKLIVVSILMLTATLMATAQAPDSLWSRTYGGSGYDECFSVEQTSDGGFILAGRTSSYGNGNYDFWLIKTDADGDTLWTKTYGGSATEYCHSVKQTADGGYILGGKTSSYGGGGYDFWVIKTTANGDTTWGRTYQNYGVETCYAVQQTTDGGYAFAGATGGGSNYDFWLIKTNAVGDTTWGRTYGGSSFEECYAMQQTSDGGYILAGHTYSYGAGDWDFWVVKTYANGDTTWAYPYGGSGADDCFAVQQTTDGGYILAGETASYGAGSWDYYLIKLNASGDTLWTRTFGGSAMDVCAAVRQTTDGGYVLAGRTYSFGAGGWDFWLLKTDADGDSLWSRRFGGPAEDSGNAMTLCSDGGCLIAGRTTSFGAGSRDFWIVKTGPVQLVWRRPAAPQELTFRLHFPQYLLQLNWEPVVTDTSGFPMAVDRYVIYRTDTLGNVWDSVGQPTPPDSSYYLYPINFNDGDQYYFQVRAVHD